ncbi:hypothetical protein lerEdw1_017181 [Lerista edwardsae]|nr:hypothetical protein lerEdw1_017181 [Lerista edwardsae]
MSRAGSGSVGWMGLLLLLLLDMVLSSGRFQSRLGSSVPEEFTAPLELRREHFGLVDGMYSFQFLISAVGLVIWVLAVELPSKLDGIGSLCDSLFLSYHHHRPSPYSLLLTDYGIKPKHPRFLTRAFRRKSEELHQLHKSKRDSPDLEEYYNDDLF